MENQQLRHFEDCIKMEDEMLNIMEPKEEPVRDVHVPEQMGFHGMTDHFFYARLEKKVDEIKAMVQQENKVLRGQLQIVVNALAEQRAMISQLLRQHGEEVPLRTKFPLDTEEKLMEVNADISINRHNYIRFMKSVLQPAGVLKNLKLIISDTLINQFNVDGVQGKKCLKNVESFYCALLESIPLYDGSGTAEEQLRKAIQLQKKRYFKSLATKNATKLT